MSVTAQVFDILQSAPLAREWIEELGWTREEITDISITHDLQFVDTVDEYVQYKPGAFTITLHHGDEVESRTFVPKG
jgi:hypothetical protein